MIRKRNGGLQVLVYTGRDPLTGRKRWVSRQVAGQDRAALPEAKQIEAALLKSAASGNRGSSGSITVAQLLDEWLAWRETNGKDIAPATLRSYRATIERRIKPGLGRLPVSKVEPRTIDLYYARLRSSGNLRTGGPVSPSRVRDVHAILSGALGLAARWGYLPFNPAVLARPPAPRNAVRKVPNVAQVRELLAAVADDPELALFVRLAAVAGMRRGEVCALRWCDLDLDRAELAVSGSVSFVSGLQGGYVRKAPKTHNGLRTLALDAPTVELLRRQRARAAETALASGVTLAPETYIFTTVADGTRPVRPDAISMRFSAVVRRIGHDYTLHGLRHFVATQLGQSFESAVIMGLAGPRELIHGV